MEREREAHGEDIVDENLPGRGKWMGGSWEVVVGATGMRNGRGRWEIEEGDCATGIREAWA